MYLESTGQEEQRDRAFTYHPPRPDQVERFGPLRTEAGILSALFNQYCPPSRELWLAQTHLQQAVMWANAAIACNEDVPPLPLSPP